MGFKALRGIIMENVNKNYIRIIVLLAIGIVYTVCLYAFFNFGDGIFDDSDENAFFIGVFGGLFIIAAFLIFGMVYVFGTLIVLSFVFATIARFSYKGGSKRVGLYRGLMITSYVFILLLALSMIFCSAVMDALIGFIVAILYVVFVIINMKSTLKANVVENAAVYTYYNPNMYYSQNLNSNNQLYNNQNFVNPNYNNQNFGDENYVYQVYDSNQNQQK